MNTQGSGIHDGSLEHWVGFFSMLAKLLHTAC
jgi:hypothetical protein